MKLASIRQILAEEGLLKSSAKLFKVKRVHGDHLMVPEVGLDKS